MAYFAITTNGSSLKANTRSRNGNRGAGVRGPARNEDARNCLASASRGNDINSISSVLHGRTRRGQMASAPSLFINVRGRKFGFTNYGSAAFYEDEQTSEKEDRFLPRKGIGEVINFPSKFIYAL